MDCSSPIPGPRGDRNWFNESTTPPPKRPPELRTVALLVAAFFVVIGSLSILGGEFLAWWRA